MSRLYGPVHRSLQERFDTRALADNVEKRVVLTPFSALAASAEHSVGWWLQARFAVTAPQPSLNSASWITDVASVESGFVKRLAKPT